MIYLPGSWGAQQARPAAPETCAAHGGPRYRGGLNGSDEAMRIFNMRSGRTFAGVALRKQFTLIEMLVVIAIISILASLLMPSLISAQHTARRMMCMNNLKNMSVAIGSYGTDYGQHWFPPPVGPGRNYRVTWEIRILPYYGVQVNLPANLLAHPADYGPGVELPVSVAPAGMKMFTCPFDGFSGNGGRARRSYQANNGGESRWEDGTSRTNFEAYKINRLIPRYNPNYGASRMGLLADNCEERDQYPENTVGFSSNSTNVYWGFRDTRSPHPDRGINVLLADFTVLYIDADFLKMPDPLIRPWMHFRTGR